MSNKNKFSRIFTRSLAILIVATMMFSFSSCGFLFGDSMLGEDSGDSDGAFLEGLIGVADTFLEGDVEQGIEELIELIADFISKIGNDSDSERDDIIDAIGGVGHTFNGAVSTESYATGEDAAAAFVEDQIVGNGNADVIAAYHQGELTSTQIENLGIPEEYRGGIEAVVEYEVVYESYDYTEADSGVEFLSDTLNREKKVTVYVIKYTYEWKYFVPMPETGDTLNKALYDSVFNYEVYKNCTLNAHSYVLAKTSYDYNGQTVVNNVEMTIDQLIMHDYGKVYLEQTITSVVEGQTTTQVIYAYMEETKEGVVCYVKMDPNSSEWMETNLHTIGFSSLDELTPFYDQYLDYTYFTVTDFGFTLADENAAEYLKQALDMSGLLSSIDESNMNIDMVCDYFVSDGVLSAMITDATVEFEVSQYGQTISLYEVVEGTTTVTDRGNTKVTKPFEEDSYDNNYGW